MKKGEKDKVNILAVRPVQLIWKQRWITIFMLQGRNTRWLVGWLVGWSVGRSVSRLVGRLVGWLNDWLIYCLIYYMILILKVSHTFFSCWWSLKSDLFINMILLEMFIFSCNFYHSTIKGCPCPLMYSGWLIE